MTTTMSMTMSMTVLRCAGLPLLLLLCGEFAPPLSWMQSGTHPWSRLPSTGETSSAIMPSLLSPASPHSASFVSVVSAEESVDDPEDIAEVDRILTATDIVKEIKAQRTQHAQEIQALEKALEDEIKTFYIKHDAALQKFRVIDSNLVQRVRNLESQIIAEAQDLREKAPTFSSWLLPALFLLVSACAVLGYLYKAMQSVHGKNF